MAKLYFFEGRNTGIYAESANRHGLSASAGAGSW